MKPNEKAIKNEIVDWDPPQNVCSIKTRSPKETFITSK